MRIFINKYNKAYGAHYLWNAQCMDCRAAFLQGATLQKDIYVEPPPEEKRDGKIWKINKAAYGLYESACQFYICIVEELEKLGMRHVTGDEAVLYNRVDEKIEGCIVLHVDNFLVTGSPLFF